MCLSSGVQTGELMSVVWLYGLVFGELVRTNKQKGLTPLWGIFRSWQNQDGGEGSIGYTIGKKPNSVYVKWPNGESNIYRVRLKKL